jgi:hypothetical protein
MREHIKLLGQTAKLFTEAHKHPAANKMAAELSRWRQALAKLIAATSASSLRTSRRLSYCGDRTGGPISAWGAVGRVPEPMHGAQVAAAPNVLFEPSKIVSRDLHRQTDSQTGQVFVQDRFLRRDNRFLSRDSVRGQRAGEAEMAGFSTGRSSSQPITEAKANS